MSLKPIDPKTLELNPFTTIGTEWMLLTAGNEDKHNTMTVSWGGLGVLWRKNVTYVLVRPQRYTMEFMDREEYYSLCVFDETYKPALKLCGTKSGRDIDKDKETGLTKRHLIMLKQNWFLSAKRCPNKKWIPAHLQIAPLMKRSIKKKIITKCLLVIL